MKKISQIIFIFLALFLFALPSFAQTNDCFYENFIKNIQKKEPNYRFLYNSQTKDLVFDKDENLTNKIEITIFFWKSKISDDFIKITLVRNKNADEAKKMFEQYKKSDVEKGIVIPINDNKFSVFDEFFLTKKESDYSFLLRKDTTNLVITASNHDTSIRFAKYFSESVITK